MPGFKTHITGSTISWHRIRRRSVGLRHSLADVRVGRRAVQRPGMMPDIDSDSSTPQCESMAFASAVVPMMLVHRFLHIGMTHEMILLAGAAVYRLIRFGRWRAVEDVYGPSRHVPQHSRCARCSAK